MIRHIFAGVAPVVLITGFAVAQVYPPVPAPVAPLPPGVAVVPPAPPALVVSPPPVPRASSSTTTTVVPSPKGYHREVTTHKEVDENGIEKETHEEGISGSSEIHTKTETHPEKGATHSTTTTDGE